MERKGLVTPHNRRRKGIILITTLFFMMLFFTLAFGVYTMSPRNDERSAVKDRTLTEAHFACGTGLRAAKEWMSAVTKPGTAGGPLQQNIDALGGSWPNGTTHIGTTTIATTNDDIFSVPGGATDAYKLVPLSTLSCPNGRFAGKTGLDFLGLAPDVNMSSADYASLKANQGNWPVLQPNTGPLKIGDYDVYTYILPSPKAIAVATGASGDSLKSYLCISIAYRSNLPILRARCLFKEVSAARNAYRSGQNGIGSDGFPIAWSVSDANSVVFDGPTQFNDVPLISVPSSYWDAALAYYPSDTTKARPKRGFMGPITFSGTNTTLSPNYDGVGWTGGNYQGTAQSRLPYDKTTGLALASTAQGSNPIPADGRPIADRYDRLIEGGRQNLRSIPAVPLPADLTVLKNAAWGQDSKTGLDTSNANPALWTVDATQKTVAAGQTTVVRPAFLNSVGATVNPATYSNAAAADVGMFINPEAGTTKAAGGIAIKGDTRNMFLEVTDGTGKIVTSGLSSSALADPKSSGSTAGNPTIRIQSTIDSYDQDSGTPTTAYTRTGTSPGTYTPTSVVATQPGSYAATQNAQFHPTQPGVYRTQVDGVYHNTVNGVFSPTVNGVYHATVPGVYHPPSGSGSGSGYWDPTQSAYWSPATQPGSWTTPTQPASWNPPTNPASWNPPTQGAYTSPTVPGSWTAATVPATTIPATTSPGAPIYGASGTVLTPFTYKAQDWAIDVKNIPLQIQPAITIPSSPPTSWNADQQAWAAGVGSNLQKGDNNAHFASELGADPLREGVSKVYVHVGASDIAGTKITSGYNVPTGKIVLYKQSRSDSNRVDAFILDNPLSAPSIPLPAPASGNKPGLNGAVYSTGNISGLRGVNMEARTIGVDYSTGKGIGIVDNILQYGTTPGQKPINAWHGLGLVGTQMNVQTRENRFAGGSFYIYAQIIAGKTGGTGGLDVSHVNNDNTVDFTRTAMTTDANAAGRTLQIFGGLTEQVTKGRLASDASGLHGWNQQFNYDKQLSYNPPPFFPKTNQLAPLAYYQEVVIGQ
jgi:hypothetical protein|eukprot:TRINITY_DN30980_c0_g1_i1.p1 TRINITY_DN30980_c0_g1~~TRINITY_DN30980_c0_g1_i1.p1  ORF type:complete len:1040 (+),score=122.10 TRINITY_DN30980_c0_g1_i1:1460-4579(+)